MMEASVEMGIKSTISPIDMNLVNELPKNTSPFVGYRRRGPILLLLGCFSQASV